MKKLIVAAALVLLLAAEVPAETEIHLKNGSVVRGEVVKETPTELVVRIEGLGKVRVPRGDILRIGGGSVIEKPPTEPDGEEPAEVPDVTPIEVPFEKAKKGETVLVLFKGEDRGSYRYSGRRVLAKVEVASAKRMKLLLDPEAGVLGFTWITAEQVDRVIRIEGHPDRLVLLIEGMESGCWVRGKTLDGTPFSGRLDRLSRFEAMTLTTPNGQATESRDIVLTDVREVEAFVRSRDLFRRLATIRQGEPVTVTIADRPRPVEGRWAGANASYFLVEVAEGVGEPKIERLFRGLPISDVQTLPKHLRKSFEGVSLGDVVTLTMVSVDDESVVRRDLTGRLVSARPNQLVIETAEGREEITAADIRSAARPEAERVEALMARLDSSRTVSILSVFPGMPRAEAERLLGDEHPGIDVIFEDGKVAKVYCSPPMKGPLFGMKLGEDYRKTTKRTDLVFDTRVEAMEVDGQRTFTLLSHTLKGMVVKLFVAHNATVLAMEISRR